MLKGTYILSHLKKILKTLNQLLYIKISKGFDFWSIAKQLFSLSQKDFSPSKGNS